MIAKSIKRLLFISYVFLLSSPVYSQDSLNCKRLADTENLINRIWHLDVKDNYAFSVWADTFTILDISDLYNVRITFQDSIARQLESINVDENYAYISSSENGIFIFDISNPYSPQLISNFKNSNYFLCSEVKNDILYAGVKYGLLTLDISEKSSPQVINVIDENIDDVWSINITDTLMFASSEDTGLKIFNISNPREPEEIIQLETSPNVTADDSAIRDNIIYVMSWSHMHVFDIVDVRNPILFYTLEYTGGYSIKIEGNYAYTLISSQLTVIDIGDPEDLKIVGYYPVESAGANLYVRNRIAYVSTQSKGIQFIKFDPQSTGVKNNKNIISETILHNNYPNPFNPTTVIQFDLAQTEFVKLTVYDLLGSEVTTLLNKRLPSGTHRVNFNASNFPSGIYFYKLQSETALLSNKMLLTK